MLEAFFQSSIDLTLFLQSLDWLISPMKFFTFLGSEDFYALVMPVLIWSIDYALGIRVGVILLSGSSLNFILKWVFHTPRPYWYDDRVVRFASEKELFGIPSGHSQFPASIYGLIAYTLKRTWVWITALVLIVLIGGSRVVLGAHFSIDVMAGWLLGSLVLWAFLKLEAPVLSWFNKQSFGQKIGSVFLISLGLTALGFLVNAANNDFPVPAEWVTTAGEELDPFNPNDLISSTGSLFGLTAGAFWLARRGGFNTEGALWNRAVRFVIGLVGVLAILRGLDAVFPDSQDVIGYGFRYLRYGLMGVWTSGWAPALFKRVGLASHKNLSLAPDVQEAG